MSRKIKVTQRHIEEGEPDSAHSCPIALAVIEAYEKDGYSVNVDVDKSISVNLNKITAKHKGAVDIETEEYVDFTVKVPGRVDKFISDFDNRQPVKPIEITLPF